MKSEAKATFDALEVLWAQVAHKFMSRDFDRESGLRMAVEEGTFKAPDGTLFAIDRLELQSTVFGRRIEFHVAVKGDRSARREILHVGHDEDGKRHALRLDTTDPNELAFFKGR